MSYNLIVQNTLSTRFNHVISSRLAVVNSEKQIVWHSREYIMVRYLNPPIYLYYPVGWQLIEKQANRITEDGWIINDRLVD